jgi:hypothetical protein
LLTDKRLAQNESLPKVVASQPSPFVHKPLLAAHGSDNHLIAQRQPPDFAVQTNSDRKNSGGAKRPPRCILDGKFTANTIVQRRHNSHDCAQKHEMRAK